jgi:hypothetical protein
MLNVVKSEGIPHTDVIVDGPADNDFFTATGPGTFTNLKATYRDNTGAGWRYCIFGHQYQEDGPPTGSSGIGETPGDDFIVTLGTFADTVGTAFDRAATFAHELGHTFGLGHAGGMDATIVGNGVPTIPSIMSYAYQLRGIRSHMMCLGLTNLANLFKEIDYSDGRMPNVDEGDLPEASGMGMNAVDWNCNGGIAGLVSHDLDSEGGTWCASGGGLDLLQDANEWQAILALPESQEITAPDLHEPCVTRDQHLALSAVTDCPPGGQASLTTEPCRTALMVFVDHTWNGTQSGTGTQPYKLFGTAYTSAPNSSSLYFRQGTYNTGTGVLNKPLYLSSPAGATLVP